MALMYIGLLAYSQVFCGAVAAVLWGAAEGAWAGAPQLIFGMMVIPLSCMELDEQVSIQTIMALVRFVAIFIIVFGSVSALYLDDSESSGNHAPYWAPQELEKMSYTSCFSGFGVAFSTSLFSQLFQHSIPGLLRPLKGQPEKLPHVPVCCAKSHVLFQNATLLTSPPSPTALDSANTRSFSFNYIELIPAAWNDRSILFWRWNAIVD
jgi:amino acid permease